MRFIDTNLFLRYLTNDDEVKAQRVLALLTRVEQDEEKITTSPMVIFETIFTLEKSYRIPKSEIRELVLPILALKGLQLPHKEIYRQALGLYIAHNISFTDAFNAACMLTKGIEEIYSYDEDFDKVKGVKRRTP
jgi:predicted nucleic acid-binding protein